MLSENENFLLEKARGFTAYPEDAESRSRMDFNTTLRDLRRAVSRFSREDAAGEFSRLVRDKVIAARGLDNPSEPRRAEARADMNRVEEKIQNFLKGGKDLGGELLRLARMEENYWLSIRVVNGREEKI